MKWEQMAYRFTDTGKWDDEWFIELDPHQKLMFMYFCDNCDIAGFYELSLRKMAFDLNMPADEVKIAFKGLEKCYILSKDKKVLFIKNFIKHQKNSPLNTNNKAHVGIIARYKMYCDKFDKGLLNLFEKVTKKGPNKGLKRGTGIGIGTLYNEEDSCIGFDVFWNLYNYRVGDKNKCKVKWESLKYDTQEKIITSLPAWNKQFENKGIKPYPATYLNQERWNDEIIHSDDAPNKSLVINF